MNLIGFLNRQDNIFAQNRLLKVVVIFIGLAVVYNSWRIDEALHYQRTVLVPFGIGDKSYVSGDNASEEYIKAFARTVASLALTYHPTTVGSQFNELLAAYDTEAFTKAKAQFMELKEKVELGKISSVFHLQGVVVDRDRNEIELIGLRKIFREATHLEDTYKTYIIGYKMSDGRIKLTSLSEKDKNQPPATTEGARNGN